ncbi:YraN family protein [Candidatus Sumerlaeota bacterium]|nr:YraN family protein [Candidatus Sumerlaeota bacterium]
MWRLRHLPPRIPPENPLELGAWGEAVAVRHFWKQGWRILERNYVYGKAEIDVIAEDHGELVILEIRTRVDPNVHPSETITARKSEKISQAAHQYIQRHCAGCQHFRFDTASVIVAADRRSYVIDHQRAMF